MNLCFWCDRSGWQITAALRTTENKNVPGNYKRETMAISTTGFVRKNGNILIMGCGWWQNKGVKNPVFSTPVHLNSTIPHTCLHFHQSFFLPNHELNKKHKLMSAVQPRTFLRSGHVFQAIRSALARLLRLDFQWLMGAAIVLLHLSLSPQFTLHTTTLVFLNFTLCTKYKQQCKNRLSVDLFCNFTFFKAHTSKNSKAFV